LERKTEAFVKLLGEVEHRNDERRDLGGGADHPAAVGVHADHVEMGRARGALECGQRAATFDGDSKLTGPSRAAAGDADPNAGPTTELPRRALDGVDFLRVIDVQR